MENLTARQAQILKLIEQYTEKAGYPPTRSEICAAMGFRSPNAAEEHLKALARKGVIEMIPGASRGIRLTQEPGVPVVGRVAAGSPIEAVPGSETMREPFLSSRVVSVSLTVSTGRPRAR